MEFVVLGSQECIINLAWSFFSGEALLHVHSSRSAGTMPCDSWFLAKLQYKKKVEDLAVNGKLEKHDKENPQFNNDI